MPIKVFAGDPAAVEKEFNHWQTANKVMVLEVQPSCSLAIMPIGAPSRAPVLGIGFSQPVQVTQMLGFTLTVLYEEEAEPCQTIA